MLRVIKQKANDSLLEAAATSISQSEIPRRDPPEEPGTPSNLFSHVPSCVSLGGSVPSSNSSITSDKAAVEGEKLRGRAEEEDAVEARKQKNGPTQPHNGDSLNDESRAESCPVVKTIAGSRKVSFSHSDLGGGGESGANPKRPRLDSCSSVCTPVMMPIAAESRLLTMSDDGNVLNPLHLFIRAQIEVFTAAPSDIALPAPGRKVPIQLHQVGLRCIHCRHLPARNRVKRAVCYPSSVGRVYNSVSDMKFDHFNNCRGFPQALRAKLKELMIETKKKVELRKPVRKSVGCSSSTAQYYHDAARKMGMVDGNGRIFMIGLANEGSETIGPIPAVLNQDSMETATALSPVRLDVRESYPREQVNLPQQLPPPPGFSHLSPLHGFSQEKINEIHQSSWFALIAGSNDFSRLLAPNTSTTDLVAAPEEALPEPILLATPTDNNVLNPLHCWVRRNIEIFAANKDDLAVPAPGRKTRVLMGQVGIRCIHCAKLPLKDRVKRGVCYPPSVSGIYHSVSNMKFDHFSNCRGLSRESRAEFAALKSSGSRRGGSSGSTAQYYHDAAIRLGLVDTEQGIRFNDEKYKLNSNYKMTASATSNVAPASPMDGKSSAADGISALMFAASNANANNFGV